MNDILGITLKADTGSFVTGFKDAASATQFLQNKLISIVPMFKRMDDAIKKLGMALLGTGAAFELFFGSSEQAAARFYGQLRNVNTIAQVSEKQFMAMGQAIVDMSKRLPASAETLASGLYDVYSTGFKGAQAMDVLRVSTVAASAGLTDSATSARAIMGVLKAYGMQASEATYVSDVLFQTVNAGVITFEQLAQGMSVWVTIASSLKIPLADAASGLAAITLAGVPAAEANTALARTMTAFIKPSQDMTDMLKSMGYESGQAAIQALGFKGVLEEIAARTGGSADAMAGIFQNVEGLQGALALLAANGKNWASTAGLITDKTQVAGAAQKALEQQMKGLPMQIQLLTNNWQALRIELGTYLMPIAAKIVGFINNIFSAIDSLPTPLVYLTGLLGALSGLLMALGGAFLIWHVRTMLMRYAINNLNGVMGTTIAVSGNIVYVLSSMVSSVLKLIPGFNSAAAAVAGFGAKIALIKAATPAIAAAAFVLIDLVGEFNNANKAAQDYIGSLRSAADQNTLAGLQAYWDTLHKVGEEQKAILKGYAGAEIAWEGFKAFMPMMDSSMVKHIETMNAVNAELVRVRAEYTQTAIVVRRASQDLFLTPEAIQNMAKEMNINLGDPARKVGDAWQELSDKWHVSGTTFDQLLAIIQKGDATLLQGSAALRQFLEVNPEWKIATVDEVYRHLSGNVQKADADQARYNDNMFQWDNILRQIITTQQINNSTAVQGSVALDQLDSNAAGLTNTEIKLNDVQKMLNQSIQEIGSPLTAFQRKLEEAKNAAQEKAQADLDAGRITKEAYQQATEDVKLSLTEMATALEEQNTNLVTWQQNFLIVSQRFGTVGGIIAQYIASMGEKGVDLMAKMATGSDDETTRMRDAILKNIELTGQSAGPKMDIAMQILSTAGARGGKATALAIANELHIGVGRVGAVADEYGQRIADGINPVLRALGVAEIKITRQNFEQVPTKTKYAQGGPLPSDATYMPPQGVRGLVQWAEGETGGEWFIPRAKTKRSRSTRILADVAEDFGYGLVRMFAAGGFNTAADIPMPPETLRTMNTFGRAHYDAEMKSHDAAVRFMDLFVKTTSSGPGGPVPPGSLKDWLVAAIEATGVPLSWLSGLYARAMQESGGNPHAINLWDANWRAGHPSKGLMQTIDSTFNAYALPGHTNIWDPVDNAIAAIRYILARYGSVYNLPKGGYAQGGFHLPLFDSGGTLRPGVNTVFNGTGKPERLLSMADGGAAGAIWATQIESWQRGLTAGALRNTAMGQNMFNINLWNAGGDEQQAIEQTTQDLLRLAETYQKVADVAGVAAADQIANANLTADEFESAADKVIQAAEAEKQALRDAQAVEDVRYQIGEIAAQEYIEILRKRLEATKKYSQEWKQIWDEINTISREAIDKQNQMLGEIADIYTTAQQEFESQQQAYADAVKQRNERIAQEVKQFRDDIMQTYADLTDPVKIFGGDKNVSSGQIEAALRHRLDAVRKFAEVYQQLVARGLNTDVLTELAQGGPDNLSLAQALLKVDPTLVNEAMVGTRAVGGNIADIALRWERAKIAQKAYDEIALPSVKTLNQLIQEQIDKYNEKEKLEKTAMEWAKKMAEKINPDLAESYRKLAAQIAAAAAAQQALNNAMGAKSTTPVTLPRPGWGEGSLPWSFDAGGWLQPGLTLAYNGTGAPERVGGPTVIVERGAVQFAIPAGSNVDIATVRRMVDDGFNRLANAVTAKVRA